MQTEALAETKVGSGSGAVTSCLVTAYCDGHTSVGGHVTAERGFLVSV